MTAVRLNQLRSIVIGVAAAIIAGGPGALAQTSVKAVFEKHKLIGTFAFDCSKPARPSNLYFRNRALDDNRVQMDQMNGPTSREYVFMIDKATESKPSELDLSGTRNDRPVTILWRIEPDRVVRLEFSVGKKKLHAGGRYTYMDKEVPPLRRCGG
jgi:hypothetical protein